MNEFFSFQLSRMADTKAIEDCKREITLLQVIEFIFFIIIKLIRNLFEAIKSSQCHQIYLTFYCRK